MDMETAALPCPLCCNETFPSLETLKYHLLGIIDNLSCPACNTRFDSVLDLVSHLEQNCNEPASETGQPIKVEPSDSEAAAGAFEQVFVQPNLQEDDNDTTSNAAVDDGDSAEAPKYLYTCQMCNISFDCVEDHLARYHEGEEVVLEFDSENEANESTGNSNGLEQAEEQTANMTSSSTLQEEECLDKDGRVYTRKVVKIDKFWMDQHGKGDSGKIPISEKFLVNNGKITKLTDKEAEKIGGMGYKIIEIHQCSKCGLQFPDMTNFNNHVCNSSKQKKSGKVKYKCADCGKAFPTLPELNTHMKTHLHRDESGKLLKTVTMGPQLCEVCNTMFPSCKSLRLHMRMHNPVKNKEVEAPVHYNIMGASENQEGESGGRQMFTCTICNKDYDVQYKEVHLESHSDTENIICSICNKKFFSKDNLTMHLKAHTNQKKFVCSYCKKAFNNYYLFQDHLKNQCSEREYECQYCGRRFSRPHEKVKHERIHTGEKPHVCNVCGKAFRVSYCLTLHMRTHSGTRPYACNQCGKRFKSHSVYSHHLQTHSDIRKYQCPFCPKAFKTAVQLAGHKNSHTKPFSCTVCNRPFASLYSVRAHMETHKRENNLKFDCWLCGATYARSFALKDHINSAHPECVVSEESPNIVKNPSSGKSEIPEEEQDVGTLEATDDPEQQMEMGEHYQDEGNEEEEMQKHEQEDDDMLVEPEEGEEMNHDEHADHGEYDEDETHNEDAAEEYYEGASVKPEEQGEQEEEEIEYVE